MHVLLYFIKCRHSNHLCLTYSLFISFNYKFNNSVRIMKNNKMRRKEKITFEPQLICKCEKREITTMLMNKYNWMKRIILSFVSYNGLRSSHRSFDFEICHTNAHVQEHRLLIPWIFEHSYCWNQRSKFKTSTNVNHFILSLWLEFKCDFDIFFVFSSNILSSTIWISKLFYYISLFSIKFM